MTKEEIFNELKNIKSTDQDKYEVIGGKIIEKYRQDSYYYVTVKVDEYYFTICGEYDSWDGITLEYSVWEDTTEKHIDIASKIREYLASDFISMTIENIGSIDDPYLKDLTVVVDYQSSDWEDITGSAYKIVAWKGRLFCIESEDGSWNDSSISVYEVKEQKKRSKRVGEITYLEI
jgi:hypothetical protein